MALKPKQKKMAELMVLEPNKTNLEYASIIGVDPKTLYKWKKCPDFQEYVHELCQQHFKTMERIAIQKLKEKLEEGKWAAISYVLDGNGYKAIEQQEINMDAKIEVDYGEN